MATDEDDSHTMYAINYGSDTDTEFQSRQALETALARQRNSRVLPTRTHEFLTHLALSRQKDDSDHFPFSPTSFSYIIVSRMSNIF